MKKQKATKQHGHSTRRAMLAGVFVVGLAILPIARALPRAFAAAAARAPVKKAAPVPFRVGEVLQYRVAWSAFSNAASVKLSLPERRNLYGWDTWHFRAAIHTQSPVRSLFQIDDQFDSYSDTSNFESHQFEEHLNEMGRSSYDVMHFAATGEEQRGPGPMVVVLPGTRDPLAALYNLRAADWKRIPEFRAPVYDGKTMYEMRARQDGANEPVNVVAGHFSTSRISVQLFRYEKEVSGIHFEIWLAKNAARTPVLMRADLPFGHIRAELITATD